MTFDPFLYIIIVMEIIEVKTPIYKFHCKEHSENKQAILDAIKEIGTFSMMTNSGSDCQIIHNTDYHLSNVFLSEEKRTYMPIVISMIKDHLSKLTSIYDNNEVFISSGWFQQYEKGGRHSWHTHGHCQLSSVYFLELPEDGQTRFKDHIGNIFTVNVEEGDYIVFPSSFLHCSLPNKSDKRKSIISFNLNIRG